MTSDFLNCTICPKKPSFSDVSHLLTHIGSKGHLAHLHSLQVRSHQEVGATQKLAAYNQWYGDYGLAALLSDRMQQKEQKQANKRAANRRRLVNTSKDTSDDLHKSKKQADLSVSSTNSIEDRFFSTDSRSDRLEDLHRPADNATSLYPFITSSPVRIDTTSRNDDDEYVDSDFESLTKGSQGSPKLKGTQWPGMALFDAAPEDLRRKRNQRKDGSVLQKLERNAANVQPTETVHSAVGTVLKHRHMDNLEDDSPVEGEEVVVEPTPKKRKSGGQRNRRQVSDTNSVKPAKLRRKRPSTPIKRSGSPISKTSKAYVPSSPAEIESVGSKPRLRKLDRKKRKRAAFTIFEDSSPSVDVQVSHQDVSSAYIGLNTIQPKLVYRRGPLTRGSTEPYESFKVIRNPLQPVISALNEVGEDKENHPELFPGSNFGQQARTMTNPLYFHDDERQRMDAAYFRETHLSLSSNTFANPFRTGNTFMTTRNPLISSMQDPNEHGIIQEEYEFDGIASQHSRMLFAP